MKAFVSGFRRASAVGTELLLLALLAAAMGKDVSQAAAKCDTAFDCTAQCVNFGRGSTELVETTRRFTTGNQALRCGDEKLYVRPACAGAPFVTPANCANNCCK